MRIIFPSLRSQLLIEVSGESAFRKYQLKIIPAITQYIAYYSASLHNSKEIAIIHLMATESSLLPQYMTRVPSVLLSFLATSEITINATVGSQDGLCKAFEIHLDPCSQDDELFVENLTYPGAFDFLHPYGCKLIPVPINEHGIQPEQVSKFLQESSSLHSSSYPFRKIDQQKRKKRR
eukprot:12368086-Ditylum_brightwellii.AAC.1